MEIDWDSIATQAERRQVGEEYLRALRNWAEVTLKMVDIVLSESNDELFTQAVITVMEHRK